MNVGKYSLDEYSRLTESFHGSLAPGMLMGGIMVDAALDRLKTTHLYDAICETSSCLPDAIQLLTPCTIGNGWLHIVDLGRFALTLYEKELRQGGAGVSGCRKDREMARGQKLVSQAQGEERADSRGADRPDFKGRRQSLRVSGCRGAPCLYDEAKQGGHRHLSCLRRGVSKQSWKRMPRLRGSVSLFSA